MENLTSPEKVKYFIETFGCQMNILDSELVEGQFQEAGYTKAKDAKDANVFLLNTCSVRKLSEQKVLSRLGILQNRKDKGESIVVGVLGCMAERANDDLIKKKPVIDVIIGPSRIHETKNLVEQALKSKEGPVQKSLSYFVNRKGIIKNAVMSPYDDLEAFDKLRPTHSTKAQAYVRITRGCNKFCAFCVVPRTRGPEMHRPLQTIVDEVKRLTDSGAKEVTLLGQTINHYFYEEAGKKVSFADLLFQVHESVPHLPRLRFLTSYPRDFTDEALDVMKECDRICKFLHIPAQSGSDKVLKEMNRGYDLETYMSLIHRAKERMPGIALLGDMIVGFPNESDEDFEMSLDLLRTVQYKGVFVFKYSPRPNTVADKRFEDNIPHAVKKERNNIMLNVQNEISHALHNKMIGETFEVLCEGESKINPEASSSFIQIGQKKLPSETARLLGRTTGDHIIHFNGSKDLIGQIVKVTVDSARQLSLSGHLQR